MSCRTSLSKSVDFPVPVLPIDVNMRPAIGLADAEDPPIFPEVEPSEEGYAVVAVNIHAAMIEFCQSEA